MKNPTFLRSRKFWQRTIFSFVFLTSVVAVLYLVENYRGRVAWEQYRRESTTRGAKLDFIEFIPPRVADEQNFAATPLFAELNSSDSAISDRAVKGVSLPGAGLPLLGLRTAGRGKVVDLEAWQKYLLENSFLPTGSDNPAQDVLEAMKQYEPILAQLQEAAKRPYSRFNGGWEKGFNADVFRSRWQLSLSEMVSLHIAALLALGRTEQAMADWRVMYRHAAMFEAEPTLLVGILRVVLLAKATNCIWQGLAAQQWTETELRELETYLSAIDLFADYKFAVASERGLVNSFAFDQLKALPWIDRFKSAGTLLMQSGPDREWSWLGFLPAGWFDQNQLRINQWFDRHLREIGAPLDQRSRITQEEASRIKRHWSPYSFVETSFGDNLDDIRQVQTDIQLCRVACALERFHFRNGVFPAALKSLVPTELPALPYDAFGHSLFYSLTTDHGLLLYSCGRNGRDDGAQEDDLAWHIHVNTAASDHAR